MTEKIVGIDEFLEINVKIHGKMDSIESSTHSKIHDLFESHLKESLSNQNSLMQYGIDIYKIKTGDEIKIFPSKWTNWFSEDKNLPLETNYDLQYRVVNIEIQYYSKNPDNDSELPKVEILIELDGK